MACLQAADNAIEETVFKRPQETLNPQSRVISKIFVVLGICLDVGSIISQISIAILVFFVWRVWRDAGVYLSILVMLFIGSIFSLTWWIIGSRLIVVDPFSVVRLLAY